MLGLIYIAHLDATTPEQAWPLQSPGPGEPDWLALNLGKHDMWEFCDPLREDGCFREMLVQMASWGDGSGDGADSGAMFTPDELKDGGFPNIRSDILAMLGLQRSTTRIWQNEQDQEEQHEDGDGAEQETPSPSPSNPYYRAANILSQLMPLEYSPRNLLKFAAFTHYTTSAFRALWGRKDPGALILIVYWYAKAVPSPYWWIRKRALLECQAICIYMERHHSDIPHLDDILQFPKTTCGLSTI
ncbi:hypothetical protein BD289DRAFT_436768, partial [Coniella lustricola]